MNYYNIRDPKEIQKEAAAEIPLEQVHADWPVSTDVSVHLKTIMNCSPAVQPSSIFTQDRLIRSE